MRPPAGGAPAQPPPQVTMGLLDYITVHSLDEDYAAASERAGAAPEEKPASAGLAALVILGLFGLLIATAAVQTSRNAVAEESGRDQLVTQVEARTAKVEAHRNRITEMRAEIDDLRNRFLETTAQGRQLNTQLSRLGVRTGVTAVRGPGVKVVADDAPQATTSLERVLDKDLQKLVNALWASGAEAISVNGLRLTNLSAIRHAGDAITVNGRSLSPPYTVLAIGNPDTLPARFVDTSHGRAWLDLQATYGLQFEMTTEESLTLPAANPPTLRHARLPEAAR